MTLSQKSVSCAFFPHPQAVPPAHSLRRSTPQVLYRYADIVHRALPRIHNVCLVLRQVVDIFCDAPLAKNNLDPHGHEPVIHICTQSVYKMYATVKDSPPIYIPCKRRPCLLNNFTTGCQWKSKGHKYL